jgi:hypothetical protein
MNAAIVFKCNAVEADRTQFDVFLKQLSVESTLSMDVKAFQPCLVRLESPYPTEYYFVDTLNILNLYFITRSTWNKH